MSGKSVLEPHGALGKGGLGGLVLCGFDPDAVWPGVWPGGRLG